MKIFDYRQALKKHDRNQATVKILTKDKQSKQVIRSENIKESFLVDATRHDCECKK